MPMYAYACKDCGHAFDIQQSFTDDSLTVCPQCSGVLRKKFNSVGVVFKGSGFYRNDSRDTKTSSESGASSDTSGASSETRPAPSKTSTASESTSGTSASPASPSSGSATDSPSKSPAKAS